MWFSSRPSRDLTIELTKNSYKLNSFSSDEKHEFLEKILRLRNLSEMEIEQTRP